MIERTRALRRAQILNLGSSVYERWLRTVGYMDTDTDTWVSIINLFAKINQ